MVARKIKSSRQPYPREKDSLLAKRTLFPPHLPPLSDKSVLNAIKAAFDRTGRDRVGKIKKTSSSPEELVSLCIKHLKTRSGPIIGTFFYSQCAIKEIFELDAIPHEMQRQRMNIGVFYQYLIIQLMRESAKARKTNIEAVFDGSREGDVVADLRTPGFKSGVRIYASVKKSADTVGGQDVPGVIERLENVAKSEKNITRPYVCVFCYATPPGGVIRSYIGSRGVRYNKEGYPFSENCESWEPGFVYPFVCGRSAIDIYKLSISKIGDFLPFYSLKFKKECSDLLIKKLSEMGLISSDGEVDQGKFLEFVTSK